MTGGGKVAGVAKIAVVRANALGDFIFVLPALRALRATYPAAEIVFLGKPWLQDFAPGRVDAIDRVVAVPPCEGVGAEPGTPSSPGCSRSVSISPSSCTAAVATPIHSSPGWART